MSHARDPLSTEVGPNEQNDPVAWDNGRDLVRRDLQGRTGGDK